MIGLEIVEHERAWWWRWRRQVEAMQAAIAGALDREASLRIKGHFRRADSADQDSDA